MKFLITAGPTREALDPVRYISNRSSGKMGYAIAAAAAENGHEVVLVSGPVSLPVPQNVICCPVTTAEDMLKAVQSNVDWCDVLVMAAAVADWRPKQVADRKWKKRLGPPQIEWEMTPDILSVVSKIKKTNQVFWGFAAETTNVREEALAKLHDKKLDAIVMNDVSRHDVGFEVDDNQITILFSSGAEIPLPKMSKMDCARHLVEKIAAENKNKKN